MLFSVQCAECIEQMKMCMHCPILESERETFVPSLSVEILARSSGAQARSSAFFDTVTQKGLELNFYGLGKLLALINLVLLQFCVLFRAT